MAKTLFVDLILDTLKSKPILATDSDGKIIEGSFIFTELYFGDPSSDGTWRIIPSGNNLVFQRRESGVWNEKSAVTP